MRPIWRSAGLDGMAGGGPVRSRGGRRQGTGPVVADVSRKIVNTDWLEVDEGDLPVLCKSDGAEEWTGLFAFSRLLFS